jgi:hypothetical protein
MELQAIKDERTGRIQGLAFMAETFKDEKMLTRLYDITSADDGDVSITFRSGDKSGVLYISNVDYSSQDDIHDPE